MVENIRTKYLTRQQRQDLVRRRNERKASIAREKQNLLNEIKKQQDRLRAELKKREQKFGKSPRLRVRRSDEYKDITAEARAQRRIIEELRKLIPEVEKGAVISQDQLQNFENRVREVERAKTARAKSNLARKRAEFERDVAKKLNLEREEKVKKELKSLSSLEKPEILKKARELAPSLSKQVNISKADPNQIKEALKKKEPVKYLKVELNLSEEDKLFNKLKNKESLTVQEKKDLEVLLNTKSKNLSKKQLKLLKNAPKDIAIGLFEVGKEIFYEPVKASFNFGKSLRKRFEAGENNPLFNDIKKLALGTIKTADFVKNNPKEAAAIAGLAVASGGKQYSNAFIENPVKTTAKTAGYLFPGTIIKGGVKTTGLGVSGVKTVTQAKRLDKVQKQVKPLRDILTLRQNNQLDRLTGSLSKISKKSLRDKKINDFLNKAAKQQGIKLKKTSNINTKISDFKSKTKVLPIGDITKKAKVSKVQPKKPIKVIDVKKGKVSRVSKVPKTKPKVKRDTTKYFKIEDGKLKKVTKKEFKKIEPKLPKEQPKKPVKLIDIKEGKVSKVSTKSPKLQSKDIFRGKKGQVRIFRDAKNIDDLAKKEVTRVSNKLKKIKNKPTKKKISTLKKEIDRLKKFVNSANANNLGRLAAVIKALNTLTKDVNAVASALDKGQKPIPDTKTTPKKDISPAKAKKPVEKSKSGSKSTGKVSSVNKIIPKKTKKPITSKKPPKQIKTIRIPRIKSLPKTKNERNAYLIEIKEGKNIIRKTSVPLPLNRARNLMRRILDTTPQASGTVKPKGRTKIQDVKTVILKQKFRVKKSKNKKVLNTVEKRKYRIDTKGEKRALAKKRKK